MCVGRMVRTHAPKIRIYPFYFLLVNQSENISNIARMPRIVSYGGIVSGKHTIMS